MFIVSNFVVGQAKWQQKMRTEELIICHCFIQSHTPATASCDWGSYATSRLVAHPNRPGVVFTHTPQVQIWEKWMDWMDDVCKYGYNDFIFFTIASRFGQPTSSTDQKWRFYVVFGRCCTLNLRRRVERDLRRGRWTNHRPQTERGPANELQRQQEVTSGCRFGSPVPLPAPFAKCINEKAAKRRKDFVFIIG